MSELLIFDKDDNLLTILSNEGEQTCPFWDAQFKEILNNGSFFEFNAPGDHKDSKYIVAENQVSFMDKDGNFRLFTVKEPERVNGEDGPIIHAICEPASLELADEILDDVRAYGHTINTALTRALQGTRWRVGQTADFGISSTNYYYINVIEAISKILNTWGGEFRDRIEIKDNKIIGRYIDILPRRGEDTGKRWEIDKDILSLSHKVQSYPKTALYGRGSSLEILGDDGEHTGGYSRKITFADVVWRKSAGDPVDKPLGQEWVGDPDALTMYGRKNDNGTLRHRFGIFESSEQEDPSKLLRETWDALQIQKRPVENYDMDVFLLEEITGYEHEKVRLGDTTFAIDRSFAEPIITEERVVVFEYDVADPDNTGRVELGQYIDIFDGDSSRLDKIESTLNDRAPIWDKGGGPITDDSIEDIEPEAVTGFQASGGVRVVMIDWDYDPSIHIASYELFASKVNEFTPDPSNLVFKGKTSGYAHKTETDDVWYYRIRTVNTHGRPGPYSDEVSASTVRIISDDLLFGPDLAERLKELSKVAEIIDLEGDISIVDGLTKIGTAVINTAAIANLAITRAKIENAAIGEAQIEKLSITNSLIAANANIDGAKIADATIVNAKIANLDGAKITAGTIDVQKLKAGMLTGFTIQTDSNAANPRIVMSRDRMIISNRSGEIQLNTSGSYNEPEITFRKNGQSNPIGHIVGNNNDLLITQAGRNYPGKLALFGNNGIEFRQAAILYKGALSEPYLPQETGTIFYDITDGSVRVRTILGWQKVQLTY